MKPTTQRILCTHLFAFGLSLLKPLDSDAARLGVNPGDDGWMNPSCNTTEANVNQTVRLINVWLRTIHSSWVSVVCQSMSVFTYPTSCWVLNIMYFLRI